MLSFLFLILGLFLLITGGNFAVRGTTSLALHLNLSKGFVGLVLLGFGTSLPEVFVSSFAAIDGRGSIALGNVAGSNITNVLLVFGIALAFYPPRRFVPGVTPRLIPPQEIIALSASTAIFVVLIYLNRFEASIGAVLVAALLSYMFFHWLRSRTPRMAQSDAPLPNTAAQGVSTAVGHVADSPIPEEEQEKALPLMWSLVLVVSSFALLFIGSQFFVQGATDIAAILGVPTGIIGLSVTAIGTSLPELAVSLNAARRGEYAIVVSNVTGSCLFNLLGVIGVASMFAKIVPGPELLVHATYSLPLATLSLLVAAHFMGKYSRTFGILFCASFVFWLAYLAVQSG